MNRRSVIIGSLASVTAAATLAGCGGVPVPPDKKDYIGEWKGLGTTLTITPDGGVDWKRVTGSGSRSVSAPLQGFNGADFVAGVWFLSTSFKVQRPPYQEGGQWKMVIEGVEMTRVRR